MRHSTIYYKQLFVFVKYILYININLKLVMAKDTKSKNGNLGSFVDQVTPEPKIVLENYLRLEQLALTMHTADDSSKKLINEMIEIALSTNKQEEFLSLGERIAINSLRKLNILV